MAVVPVALPAQVQVNWLTLDATPLAVPRLHNPADGASAVGVAFALPQTPLTGVSVKEPVTVQSAVKALVV